MNDYYFEVKFNIKDFVFYVYIWCVIDKRLGGFFGKY